MKLVVSCSSSPSTFLQLGLVIDFILVVFSSILGAGELYKSALSFLTWIISPSTILLLVGVSANAGGLLLDAIFLIGQFNAELNVRDNFGGAPRRFSDR